MTLKDKTHSGLAFILLLFLLMAAAGIWGNQQLGFLLDSLTARGIKVQQSAADARLLAGGQFLAMEQLLQGRPVNLSVLAEQDRQFNAQLQDIRQAALLDAAELTQLQQAAALFQQTRQQLSDSFIRWQQAAQTMQSTVDDIVEVGALVEEVGDAQVEVLVQDPGRQISWRGGLVQK